MRSTLSNRAAALAVAVLASLSARAEGPVDRVLSDGWRFSRDAGATWSDVRVPHDWAIAGPFDTNAANGATGKLPWRGKGVYRRGLVLSPSDAAQLASG